MNLYPRILQINYKNFPKENNIYTKDKFTEKKGGIYMCEVIVVTSGKGGVGKTTSSANIGTGLAATGKRVVLIDTDILYAG